MTISFQTITPHGIAADDAAACQHRCKVGRADIAYRRHARQCTMSIRPSDASVHVVVALAGQAVVVGKARTFSLAAGEALLLAGNDRTACIWSDGARSLRLDIPRAAIQAEASIQLARPRRLAMIDCSFAWSATTLGGIDFHNPAAPVDRLSEQRVEKQMLADLVAALAARDDRDMLFPVARSVERAVQQMRSDPTWEWSAEDLAPVGGVTPATLRRNFKTCLGVTITRSAQQLRLEWVRTRLESETESRSIRDLSVAAGFGASGMLNRAYQRRFGETPTQTRTRTFRP